MGACSLLAVAWWGEEEFCLIILGVLFVCCTHAGFVYADDKRLWVAFLSSLQAGLLPWQL